MKRIDLQDVLLIAGILLIVGGIAAWSRPAAAIVLGLFCLAFVYSIATSRAPNKPEGK
jgi:Na+-transporting NADH:ubiquinone oxidoreductase subunit NqrB